MAGEVPTGRHDITITRPGLIPLPESGLQLNDVEVRLDIECRWYDPVTGRSQARYADNHIMQERAVITTFWKEAESGR